MTSRRVFQSPPPAAITGYPASSPRHSSDPFSSSHTHYASSTAIDDAAYPASSTSHYTRLGAALAAERVSSDPAHSDRVLQSSFLGMDRSMWSAAFNLTNVITGSGIIGLPYATRQCGLLVAVPVLLALAACTLYSLRLLVTAAHRLHRKRAVDVEDVLHFGFGRAGYCVGLAAVFFLDLGVMVALLIVIGDTVPPVLSYYARGTWLWAFTGRGAVLTAVAFGFILPPSSLRSLESLSLISLTSVASVALLTVLVLARSSSSAAHSSHGVEAGVEWVGARPLAGFGSMAFVFVCHDVSLQLYQGLRIKSVAAWSRVSAVSVAIALLPVLTLSVVGYLCFLDRTAANILSNFSMADAPMNAARLVLAVSMGLTYPSNLFMCRHVLTQALGMLGWEKRPPWLHSALTLALFLTTLGVALMVDDLGRVQSLVGSVCAVSLAFLIPSACAIRVAQLRDQRPLLSRDNAGAWLIAAVGTLIVTLSLISHSIDAFTVKVEQEQWELPTELM